MRLEQEGRRTGISNDDVDASVPRDSRLEKCDQLGPLAHVGALEGGACDGRGRRGDVADEDVRAVGGEEARRREADAGGAAWRVWVGFVSRWRGQVAEHMMGMLGAPVMMTTLPCSAVRGMSSRSTLVSSCCCWSAIVLWSRRDSAVEQCRSGGEVCRVYEV